MFTSKTLRTMLLLLVIGALVTAGGCSRFRKKKAVQTPPTTEQPAPQQQVPQSADTEHPKIGDTIPFPAGAVDTIYFDFDKSSIRRDQITRLNKNVDYFKANPTAKIMIEGHTDERGTVEYNFSLGQRRADAIKDYLTKNGIAAERIATVSKGEEQPAVPGHDESAWSKNRRVEFLRIVTE